MDFKLSGGVPKGKIVPMYLGDNGNLYSFRFKDLEQLEEASTMISIVLKSVIGEPLVIDTEPLNDELREDFKVIDKSLRK